MVDGMERAQKAEQLKSLLEALDCELPGLSVCDHWEADLYAIGLVHASRPELLIYVSCYRMARGRAYFSLEEDGNELDQADNAPISRLAEAIRRRIA